MQSQLLMRRNVARPLCYNLSFRNFADRTKTSDKPKVTNPDDEILRNLQGVSLQPPAGALWRHDDFKVYTVDVLSEYHQHVTEKEFIPQVPLHKDDGRSRKRVLMLCTGGTLTMDQDEDGALAPVEGALSKYMKEMHELQAPPMPEVVLHEYSPFLDSSDLGPADWARIAQDIRVNYLHFDGFVIIMGTDTMAYAATALSFMLENLGKPVVFTGSQIPLCEPYNDARRNLIMALIFASRDTINEVTIFFHDRLLRANRATKVNTHRLMAFDSPNIDPLATIGLSIDENEHLVLPPAKGALRLHTRMDTRILTVRLVPGFDDAMLRQLIEGSKEERKLRALILQLYGTGNIPSLKQSLIQLLADASDQGILVMASTQCYTGSVLLGHYAVGKALESAGVVSASDMTLEAIACKIAYLFGRGDLNHKEVASLMGVSLRGEMTPAEALSLPPLSSAYQRGMKKGKKYY
jgi:L-asparaginase